MRRAALLLTCAVLAVTGCSSPAPTKPAASPAASPSYSDDPSVSAKMICADEAQGDIATALGVRPRTVSTPTWVDHVYSCRYEYPTGVMVLSVKELPDALATAAYFDSMRTKHPGGGTVPGIGEEAYLGPDGSALVRKDFKVLWVDISGLPPKIGTPAMARSDAAYRVAVVIMGCWTGA